MPDAPTKQPPRYLNRINIHEHGEVGYWCKKFNCTRAQLIIAVHTVGPMMATVANFLHEVVLPARQQMMVAQNSPPAAEPKLPPSAGN